MKFIVFILSLILIQSCANKQVTVPPKEIKADEIVIDQDGYEKITKPSKKKGKQLERSSVVK